LEVWFDDIASHDFSDLVDETVTFLLSYPGATSAHREDRELILVFGGVDPGALRTDLDGWWREQLARLSGK
jgi:hypothetical protein